MATKNQVPDTAAETAPVQAATPEDVNTLREKHQISRAIFSGVCAAEDWKPGKQVEEGAFLEAVSRFCGSPISVQHHTGKELPHA